MSARPVTILFDANPLLGSKAGVGYYTAGLIDALSKKYATDVKLVGYYSSLRRNRHSELPTSPNLSYKRILVPRKVINLLRRLRINPPIELLTLTRADFILFPDFLGLNSLFNTPSAPVIHDLTFVDLPEYVSRKNRQDLLTFVPKRIRKSKFVITVSEFSKQRIQEAFGVPSDQVIVTPIPPEIPQTQARQSQQRLLKELGIPGKFILTLGTIEPRKNIPNMIDAYLQLPQKVQQEYTFVITGRIGWNCDREVALLEQMKREGKNILHAGYVDEATRAALFHEATLFTWASHYEGFGIPILEAMSCGIPCAVSDIPVFREVAKDTALYFNQNNPAAIATAWQKLLSDHALRERLGKAGKRHASSYRWDTVAESLYKRIIKTLGETSP